MPADFKRQVDEEYGPKFYITSVDGQRARLYPMKEWEAVEQLVKKMSAMDPIRERFLDVTTYYGQIVEMDAQGRLLIPQLIRELAGIKDEVSVMGKMEWLEVVKEATFEAQLKGTAIPAAIHLSREDLAAYADKTTRA